jgi:hypothetical protein
MEDDLNKNKKWKTTSKKKEDNLKKRKKEDDLKKIYINKIKNNLTKRNGRRPPKTEKWKTTSKKIIKKNEDDIQKKLFFIPR